MHIVEKTRKTSKFLVLKIGFLPVLRKSLTFLHNFTFTQIEDRHLFLGYRVYTIFSSKENAVQHTGIQISEVYLGNQW